jgi:uncharacterized protein (DUF1697 family)
MTGHNSIKMAELSVLYTKLGFKENKTYIQSGNVVFKSDQVFSEKELQIKIERAIFEKFGYTIAVIIRSFDEVKTLFSTNPFIGVQNFDSSKMAVVFLHENVTDLQLEKMKNISYPPDRFQIAGREIFIYCPNGFGRTKLYTNFFEDKMGVTGTARNWKTITSLLLISELI